MSADIQPDWSLLPHDPRGFFGLAGSFDRRGLKTVYGKFIRRFKPEQHPAEFQKIRAAYEQLDMQVRYGAVEELGEEPVAASSWHGESTQTATVDNIFSRPTFTPLHARLKTESPEILYQELSGLSQKSPFDFYALALLSDVVTPPSEGRFATWLMAGIAEAPRDPGLHHLLQLHFQGPIPTEALPKLLTQGARQVSELFFYPLTEKLWLQLLREKGFAVFRDTLARSIELQPGIQIANRLTFYLQILRHAIWEADPAWIAQTIAYVEENFRHIPYQLGNEIDLLLALQNYATCRPQFIARHPLRAEMDAVVRSYFTDDEYVADRQMIACQEKLLANPALLGEAFSNFDEPGLSVFYSLWAWLSRDAADRNFGAAARFYPDPMWQSEGRALVSRADRLAHWTWSGILWSFKKIGFLALMGFAIFVVPVIVTLIAWAITSTVTPRQHEETVTIFTVLAGIGVGLFFGIRCCGSIQRKWSDPLDARMLRRCYDRYWRAEVLALLARSHLPVPTLMHFIGTSTNTVTRAQLIRFIERDYALAIYSLAQRYVA